MTDQTEFSPEVVAEANRLWCESYVDAYRRGGPDGRHPDAATTLAIQRLLVATGFKPPVDPIEAKAREIVAGDCDPETVDAVMDGHASYALCHLVKLGILAGMEMGKP